MRIQIPKSLRLEHEEIHDFLAAARQEPGELGDALRRVVRLARNDVNSGMADVYPHTDWLKNNLPTLMAEHHAIAAAIEEVLDAARGAQRIDCVELAEKLLNHLRMEEEVMYPAAILVGEYLRLLLGKNEGIVAL